MEMVMFDNYSPMSIYQMAKFLRGSKVRFGGRAGKGSRKGRIAGYMPKLRGITRNAPKFAKRMARIPYGKRPTTLRSAGAGGLIKNVNGSLTNTMTTYYNKPSRLVGVTKAITAAQTHSFNHGKRYDGQFGFQLPFTVGEINEKLVLDTISKLVLAQATGNSPQTISYYPSQYILESVIANMTMANASTAPVELTIYDLTVRRDINSAFAIGTNNSTFIYQTINRPDELWNAASWWQNGQVVPVPPGTPYPSHYLGASPLENQIWRDYFSVNKQTRVLLSAGGVHRHTVSHKVNKLVDTSLLGVRPGYPGTPFLQDIEYLRGLTKVVMVVAKGLPVSDAEQAATVTSSDPHIDVVSDYRYKYSFVLNNTTKSYNVDNLTTPATARIVTPANAQVITVSQT